MQVLDFHPNILQNKQVKHRLDYSTAYYYAVTQKTEQDDLLLSGILVYRQERTEEKSPCFSDLHTHQEKTEHAWSVYACLIVHSFIKYLCMYTDI